MPTWQITNSNCQVKNLSKVKTESQKTVENLKQGPQTTNGSTSRSFICKTSAAEVEFVDAVTAGDSVKFLPAV